jgi:hypothetical protein
VHLSYLLHYPIDLIREPMVPLGRLQGPKEGQVKQIGVWQLHWLGQEVDASNSGVSSFKEGGVIRPDV